MLEISVMFLRRFCVSLIFSGIILRLDFSLSFFELEEVLKISLAYRKQLLGSFILPQALVDPSSYFTLVGLFIFTIS